MFMASRQGYSKYEGYSSQNKRISVDKTFFSLPNKENSYFAGFLGADGTIYNTNNIVAIKLQAGDMEILEKFKQVTKFSGKIRVYKRQTIGTKLRDTCSVNFCGVKKWIEDLESNYNVISNKSLVLKPPSLLSLDNSLAYIKGYVDGNGTISKRGSNASLSIYTSKDMATWIYNIAFSKYNLKFNISETETTTKNNLFTLRKQSAEVNYFLDDLNQSYSFGLKRKWSKLIN